MRSSMGVSMSAKTCGLRLENALVHGGLVLTPIPPLLSAAGQLSTPLRVIVKHKTLIALILSLAS